MASKKLLRGLKCSAIVLAASLLAMGCATTGSVQTRKQERIAAYEALSPEMKTAVDQGQLKFGMNADAVYISWGKPMQVLTGGDEKGETSTWIYQSSFIQQTRIWGEYRMFYAYTPVNYTRARVTFQNGAVKEWHTYAEPVAGY